MGPFPAGSLITEPPAKTPIRLRPKIINRSSRMLSDDEINLLKKLLKFTSTPKSNTSELRTDVIELCLKLRVSEKFHTSDDMMMMNTKRFLW